MAVEASDYVERRTQRAIYYRFYLGREITAAIRCMYLSQLTSRCFSSTHACSTHFTGRLSLQASKPAPPVSEEETAAEKAAKMKAAGLQKELSQANIKVDGLTRELTKAEQRAKDADDARNRQVVTV